MRRDDTTQIGAIAEGLYHKLRHTLSKNIGFTVCATLAHRPLKLIPISPLLSFSHFEHPGWSSFLYVSVSREEAWNGPFVEGYHYT